MDIVWQDSSLFDQLNMYKEEAKKYGSGYSGIFKLFNTENDRHFEVKPYGSKGFAWILKGNDFTYTIAESHKLGSRPSAMLEIRSEALWRLGPKEALIIAMKFIEVHGGRVIEAKLSRVDLCVDFLMPEKRWSDSLMHYAVTKARFITPDFPHKKATTKKPPTEKQANSYKIGSGKIQARIYDKHLEIQGKSRKYRMYDIWGISKVPEGEKIIRLEFQLRREFLKELGLNKIEDLFEKIGEAWAYCTKIWLKFQNNPEKHHTQQSTAKWYKMIQDGFNGIQGAEPLVRAKDIRIDKKEVGEKLPPIPTHVCGEKADRDKIVVMGDCPHLYVPRLSEDCPNSSVIQVKVKCKLLNFCTEKPSIEEGLGDISDKAVRRKSITAAIYPIKTHDILLTVKDVARLLQIDPGTVYKRQKELGGFKPAGLGSLRFTWEVINGILLGPGAETLAVSIQAQRDQIHRKRLQDKAGLRRGGGGAQKGIKDRSANDPRDPYGLLSLCSPIPAVRAA